jgi:PKD repeat protein
MKKTFTLLFFFLISIAFTAVLANTVQISGYVKYANGAPVVNQAVTISNDSIFQGNTCGVMVHVKYTNANGFYIDTLSCSGTITALRVTTPNCNGTMLNNTVTINQTSLVAESNFNLACNPPNTPNCTANYTFNTTGATVQFTSTSIAQSAVTAYIWKFGDGTSATIANPTHQYAASGIYNVCLTITSSNGCNDSICKAVTVVVPTACNAEFQFVRDSANYKLFKFYAGVNTAYPNNDPVIERKWKFGDGDSLMGNVQNPTHLYAQAGTYNVCLRIKTQSGCVSDMCKVLVVVNPAATACVPAFTYVPQSTLLSFNSSMSIGANVDSIISRRWTWGDSTVALTGNIVSPQHQYAQPGSYTVCLTIKTASGCEKTICKLVTATNINSACVPQFLSQRIAPKKVEFNSSMSWVAANDSIIERKWRFGDGTSILTGNLVSVQHEYPTTGVYTACLYIKTALGCVNEVCKPIVLQDSIVQPPAGVTEPIRIISMFPNPASIVLNTNIWSAYNNVAAELAIYDIYGVKKWSINKNLLQGTNFTAIPVANLLTGPYFFKVKTIYGTKSRQFFKL